VRSAAAKPRSIYKKSMHVVISSSTSNVSRALRRLPWLAWLALALSAALAQSPSTQSGPASGSASPATGAAPAQPSSKAAPASGRAPAANKAKAATPAKSAGAPSRYLPGRFAGRAGLYYKAVWGIDSLSVKWAESGELIRFSWRVLDPAKARVLNDKKLEPSLIDPKAGVSLVVPVMEKVGQLRQSQPPEAGRSYWMAFSNKGRPVRRGDRVDVVVGPFRAENLAVD
jgi:hypothetical protein